MEPPRPPTDTFDEDPDRAASDKEQAVDLVAYWQQSCVPYIRARWGRDERGASLVEYALLVALIAVVCIVAVQFLG